MANSSTEEPAIIAGRYRVERLLGQGGMGAVFEVLDRATGKRIALKRLSRTAHAGAAALFQREYHTLAGIRHPAIVQVYDYGTDAEGAYFTMEFVEGSDLGTQAPMPWREACACLRDVAATVGLLHARRLLHRDLSPRNLLRTSSGRLKLIDFGALVPFGPTHEVVGTPPFVAPEAVHESELDQRADLFALGALGYWLVTGIHAFPARSLAELPRVWQHAPALPSRVLTHTGADLTQPIPQELDTLLCALLSLDPSERPPTTGELIDRLNVIADLAPEASEVSGRGYLESKAFVGRTRERERFRELLAKLEAGGGSALLLTGSAGLGRTRLLQELAVLSRLSGTITLTADAGQGDRPFAALSKLALGLLNALPTEALDAARPYAPVLAKISRELQLRLALKADGSWQFRAPESHVQAHAALRDWLIAISQQRPLTLLVDDLHALDEASQAVLTELSFGVAHERILIVATARAEVDAPSPALQSFWQLAERMVLEPLGAPETLDLMRSVFGQVHYLERCAQRLWRASEGNPAYCLELAHHLVTTGAASYFEGVWSLPTELTPEQLPTSREEGLLARLKQLSGEQRRLAQALSLPHPLALTAAQCEVLSELGPDQTRGALDELVSAHVLRPLAGGYVWAHETVRAALYGELNAQRRKRAHRLLAEELLACVDATDEERLLACVHLLRAGERERARPLLTRVGIAIMNGDRRTLRTAAPLFEETYHLLRAAGADCYELGTPLALLSNAGYYAHRHYATNYGDSAIEVLSEVLELGLQRRLRPYLGRVLSLFVALVVAGCKLSRRKAYAPTLKEAIGELVSAAVSLTGVAVTCLDGPTAHRFANVIEPLTAFGKNHVANLAHRFAVILAAQTTDHLAETQERLRQFIARLESDKPVHGIKPAIRESYLVGAYFALGIRECWRDNREGLRIADHVEQFGDLLYTLYADYLRSRHYAWQGDFAQVERYRKRVELHAVQLGTAWQVETWGSVDTARAAMDTNNSALMKRAYQELARLGQQIPSMARRERQMRGVYLLMRGKYERALPLLQGFHASGPVVGRAHSQAMLARAYNCLRMHEKAREVCLQALEQVTPEDLMYTSLNLPLPIEHAIAEAGLGNYDEAARLLDAQLAIHEPNKGPLTLGALHEARAKVALAAGDLTNCREHLAKMDGWYRPTGVTSLIELVERLGRQLMRAEHPGYASTGYGALTAHDEQLHSALQRMLTEDSTAPVSARAQEALQVALELTSAAAGFVVLQGKGGEPVAYAGDDKPREELVRWADEALVACDMSATGNAAEDQVTSALDASSRVIGGMQYLLTPLWAGDAAVGALVLGFAQRDRQLPDARVWTALARHLAPRPPS